MNENKGNKETPEKKDILKPYNLVFGTTLVFMIIICSLLIYFNKKRDEKSTLNTSIFETLTIENSIMKTELRKLRKMKLIDEQIISSQESQIKTLLISLEKIDPYSRLETDEDKLKFKNIIKYIFSEYPNIPTVLRNEIASQIVIVSNEEKVPYDLIIAIIEVESSFNPMSISKVNARGLMQVMPFWVHQIGDPKDKVCDLHNIYYGIKMGCKVLKIHQKESNGDLSKALYHYVNEDKNYVERVMNARKMFKIIINKKE